MSDVLLVGLSHKTAPLEVREKLAVPAGELDRAVTEIRELPEIAEAMLVATCNRVEAYVLTDDVAETARRLRGYLTARAGVALESYVYEHRGEAACKHLFRVAASLDSLVIGEPQILGQVKEAYAAAERTGALSRELGRVVTRAFAVAKRVRSETSIAHGAVSVSSIAVDLAGKVLGDLQGRRVLLVGAGKMGEVSAKKLHDLGGKITVVNRSPERAEELAKACDGEARSFGDLEVHLGIADIVISSTASPKFVITHEMMTRVVKQRRYRPLFMIDIAVPRDVDPRANDLENVFVFDIDDLQAVVEENMAERRKEAGRAERIVELELTSFREQARALELVPTIKAMREHFTQVAKRELEKSLPRLKNVGPDERAVLEAMLGAVVSKLLHHPTTQLRESAGHVNGADLVAAARALFPLDADAPIAATSPAAPAPAASAPAAGAPVAASGRAAATEADEP
jgi:glutamyl-tRNA reductase